MIPEPQPSDRVLPPVHVSLSTHLHTLHSLCAVVRPIATMATPTFHEELVHLESPFARVTVNGVYHRATQFIKLVPDDKGSVLAVAPPSSCDIHPAVARWVHRLASEKDRPLAASQLAHHLFSQRFCGAATGEEDEKNLDGRGAASLKRQREESDVAAAPSSLSEGRMREEPDKEKKAIERLSAPVHSLSSSVSRLPATVCVSGALNSLARTLLLLSDKRAAPHVAAIQLLEYCPRESTISFRVEDDIASYVTRSSSQQAYSCTATYTINNAGDVVCRMGAAESASPTPSRSSFTQAIQAKLALTESTIAPFEIGQWFKVSCLPALQQLVDSTAEAPPDRLHRRATKILLAFVGHLCLWQRWTALVHYLGSAMSNVKAVESHVVELATQNGPLPATSDCTPFPKVTVLFTTGDTHRRVRLRGCSLGAAPGSIEWELSNVPSATLAQSGVGFEALLVAVRRDST